MVLVHLVVPEDILLTPTIVLYVIWIAKVAFKKVQNAQVVTLTLN